MVLTRGLVHHITCRVLPAAVQVIPSGLNQNLWVWVNPAVDPDMHSWLKATAACDEPHGERGRNPGPGDRPARLESGGWDPGVNNF